MKKRNLNLYFVMLVLSLIPMTVDASDEPKVYGCGVIPDEIVVWLQNALNFTKYVAVVLLIILGVLDFIKASASGEADHMKKSGNKLMKRIIAVVVLFFLPVMVDLILGLIEIYGADSVCLSI